MGGGGAEELHRVLLPGVKAKLSHEVPIFLKVLKACRGTYAP